MIGVKVAHQERSGCSGGGCAGIGKLPGDRGLEHGRVRSHRDQLEPLRGPRSRRVSAGAVHSRDQAVGVSCLANARDRYGHLSDLCLLDPPAPGGADPLLRARVEPYALTTPLFSALLISVVLIVSALTFFPALSLGPILEHLLMNAGKVF